MRRAIALTAAMTLLAFAGTAGAEECRYSAPRAVELDGAGLKSLLLNLGATDAHVRGVAGLSKIEVRGTACASNPSWLPGLQIDTSHSGGTATVTVRTGEHGVTFGLFGYSHYAYLKLSVEVPPQLAVEIDSGSGDVSAQALGALDFHSGSGDLKAQDIGGTLALQLASGDVEARRVGAVQLRGTGSGDVTVEDVRGDVRVEHAGSGDLHFSNVSGGVSVGAIGSGDLHLQNIGRNVAVGRIGSGDVIVDGVGGDLRVGARGSGDVSYHGVKGNVSVPKDD
jgi:Toastrack DUF4097